jgi:chitin disaccharide deacetylase
MGLAKPRRRLIVNADDFGNSASANQAIIQAHRQGVLTSASLMVNGDAFDEAVALAKENPKLGVGLHLTLCRGRSALPPSQVPTLVNSDGAFEDSPVKAGLKYFFSAAARAELQREIAAQFDKFAQTGLKLDHVNGHLHFHLHPAVFGALRKELRARRVRAVRLTHDPVRIDWPLGRGRWLYRLGHALVFGALSRHARGFLARDGIVHTAYVFGLLEDGRVSEDYLLRLARVLPAGDSELYSHPCLQEPQHEYGALVSPQVRREFLKQGIQLIRYQDL